MTKTIEQSLDKYVDGEKKKVKTEIKIPAGIVSGQSIVVRGYGGPGKNGGPNGDLYIKIYIDEHPVYKREENDIIINMDVSIFDVIAEKEIEVKTPYGTEKVKLNHNVQNGHVFTIFNHGFPSLKGKYKGDFLVKLTVKIPKLSNKEKKQMISIGNSVKDEIYEKWRRKY